MDAGHSLALLRARVAVPAGTVMTPVLVRSRPAASSQAGPTPTVDEGLNFPAVREVVPSGKIHRAPPAGAPLESVGSPLTVEDVAEARRGAPLPRWPKGKGFPLGKRGRPPVLGVGEQFPLARRFPGSTGARGTPPPTAQAGVGGERTWSGAGPPWWPRQRPADGALVVAPRAGTAGGR